MDICAVYLKSQAIKTIDDQQQITEFFKEFQSLMSRLIEPMANNL